MSPSNADLKLTSNRTVSKNADAIVVTGLDVHLDLNGFSIIGPVPRAGSAPPAGVGSGVVSSARGMTVANGSVRGFGAQGIFLVAEGRVADLRVRCAGVTGIRVGSEGRVERSAVSRSAVGVETGPTALLVDNEITSNDGMALVLGSGSAIRSNVLVGNNGGNANPQIQASGSFFELGLNRCGNGLGCSAAGVCGNGQIEAGEGCDDANASNGDGGSTGCLYDTSGCF
ncbi:hypothetical protein K2X89_00265 [Myxococcota bacterium]|nr:hypothetical protein [Myxococcota bacterium]